jgi:hypothetical protein
MESKASPPNKLIQASTDSLLTEEQQRLWVIGGQEQRDRRARAYNARVLDTLQYIASEINSLTSLVDDQLDETGFLATGTTGIGFNVTANLMDETMPEEVQERKFGDCYIQKTPKESTIVLSGIFGNYYTMGHNLELAMFDEESKARLSSIHHAIMYTWRQLYDISQEENK